LVTPAVHYFLSRDHERPGQEDETSGEIPAYSSTGS